MDARKTREFHKAVAARHINKAKALAAGGDININARDASGYTPMHHAAKNGHRNMVEFLLDIGANIDAFTSDTETARALCRDPATRALLDAALRSREEFFDIVKYGDIRETQRLLNAGTRVNIPSRGDWTALHFAICEKHPDIIRLLLSRGANVNAADWQGETPLHKAAQRGFPEIATLLVESGARVDARTALGCTPLHFAAESGDLKCICLLIRNGADPSALANDGKSLLHRAAEKGRDMAVSWLLSALKAKLAVADADGNTPLHLAARAGHRQVASFLARLPEGREILNSHNLKGETPADIAGDDEMKALLRQEPAKRRKPAAPSPKPF